MSLCWNIHSQSRLNEGTVKAMLPGHFYMFLIFILIYNIILHIDIDIELEHTLWHVPAAI
uniref:Uncharacterized protein n=1 Tax=Anguilla anguilla TaxID=7936 RepID=A0A0E9VZQ5_ANGAN